MANITGILNHQGLSNQEIIVWALGAGQGPPEAFYTPQTAPLFPNIQARQH